MKFLALAILSILGLTAALAAQFVTHQMANPDPSAFNELTFGRSGDGGHDLNADGVPDFVIGSAGQVTAVSGLDRSWIRTFAPPLVDPAFGSSCRYIGDLDADGVSDVIVASLSPNLGGSVAYVFSGATGTIIHTLTAPFPGSGFGWAITALDDINGDLIPDFAISEPRASVATPAAAISAVHVYSGATGALLYSVQDLPTSLTAPYWGLGFSVCNAGDLNGDGVSDLCASSIQPDSTGTIFGFVRAYSGTNGALLFQLLGTTPGERLGTSVDHAGDINQDGFDDLLVLSSVINSSTPPGQIYFGSLRLISGFDGSELRRINSPPLNIGFTAPARNVGDVNQDGNDDFAVCRSAFTPQFSVYSGSDGRELLSATASAPGVPISCLNVLPAGDVNLDGYNDVAIGYEGALITAGPSTYGVPGRVEVFSHVPALSEVAFGDLGPSPPSNNGILKINGSDGGLAHRVDTSMTAPLSVTLSQPTTNPNPANFAIFGILGVPTLQQQLGIVLNSGPPFSTSIFSFAPCPIQPSNPDLFTLAQSISLPCPPAAPSSAGPFNLTLPLGLPVTVTLTLQAIYESTPGVYTLSNAVILRNR